MPLIVSADQIRARLAAGAAAPTTPTGRRRLSPVLVRPLVEQGLTDGQIATRLGASRSAVRQMRQRHGWARSLDATLPPRACPMCLVGACHRCTGRMAVTDATGTRDVPCEHQHTSPREGAAS